MIGPTTPILGAGGTPELPRVTVSYLLLRSKQMPPAWRETTAYLYELYRLCEITGIDFRVAAAQWDLETDSGRSVRWVQNRNPAGLSVESDDDPDPATFTGEEAARVHVWALLVATRKEDGEFLDLGSIPASANGFRNRWVAKYFADKRCPTVVTVADLQRRYTDATGEPQATFAWDDQYARKLCERANQIFKETAMPNLTFGNVPHPPSKSRPIHKAPGAGQDDLGQRTVKGVSWHRILGSLWGTDTYFRGANVKALTDYGVGVAAQDGPEHAGEILQWNDPLGRQSGWASGTYSSAAYGDGAAFVAKYGVDAINRDRASIEISGFQDTPLDEKARDAIAALTAYWADQYEIPWDQFPIAPQDGFSFVCWHEEFGPDFGQKKCPFAVVKAETAALIERTRAILKRYQVPTQSTPKPPVYAAPDLPDWWDRSLEQSRPNDAKDGDVLWRVARRNVEALKRTQRYSEPDTKAAKSGPPTQVREKVFVERVGTVDGRQWLITDDGHYVLASGFSPRIAIQAR